MLVIIMTEIEGDVDAFQQAAFEDALAAKLSIDRSRISPGTEWGANHLKLDEFNPNEKVATWTCTTLACEGSCKWN